MIKIQCSELSFLNVFSGSRTGEVHHHDVRNAQHHVGTLRGHTQEVCGLRWSLDGKYLASGGNDNLVNVWLSEAGIAQGDSQALYTFSEHQAAVKVSVKFQAAFKKKNNFFLHFYRQANY